MNQQSGPPIWSRFHQHRCHHQQHHHHHFGRIYKLQKVTGEHLRWGPGYRMRTPREPGNIEGIHPLLTEPWRFPVVADDDIWLDFCIIKEKRTGGDIFIGYHCLLHWLSGPHNRPSFHWIAGFRFNQRRTRQQDLMWITCYTITLLCIYGCDLIQRNFVLGFF